MYEWIWIEPGLERPCSIIHCRVAVPFCKNKVVPSWEKHYNVQRGHCAPDQPHGPCFQKCDECKRWADQVVPKTGLKNMHVHWTFEIESAKNQLSQHIVFYLILFCCNLSAKDINIIFLFGAHVRWFILQKMVASSTEKRANHRMTIM